MIAQLDPAVKLLSASVASAKLTQPVVEPWVKERKTESITRAGQVKMILPEQRHGYIKCKKHDFL